MHWPEPNSKTTAIIIITRKIIKMMEKIIIIIMLGTPLGLEGVEEQTAEKLGALE